MNEQFKMNMPDQFLDEANQLEKNDLLNRLNLMLWNSNRKSLSNKLNNLLPSNPLNNLRRSQVSLKYPQYEYLEKLPDNPMFVPMATGMRVAGSIATGTVDTVMDTASFLVPWLKPADDWWEEVSYRKETTGFDKAVRDVGGFLVPFLGLRNLAMKGVTMGATKLGMTGMTKGLPGILTNIGVSEGVGLGLAATNDNTTEVGNTASLIETVSDKFGFGIQVPWASREGDSEDVIYQKNMFDEAMLSGVSAMIDLTFSKYGIGRVIKPLTTKLVAKDEVSKAIIDASPQSDAAKAVDPIQKLLLKKQLGSLHRLMKLYDG